MYTLVYPGIKIPDANGPYSMECQGEKTVLTLDGTGSYVPDNESISYTWAGDCSGESFDGSAAILIFDK